MGEKLCAAALDRARQLGALPPVLTFQSVIDFTVSTPAILTALYANLPDNGSEIVLFDVNRTLKFAPLLRPSSYVAIDRLTPAEPATYRFTAIANANDDSETTVERSIAPGQLESAVRPLSLPYPPGIFSLSHLAIPIPMDDPLYGMHPDPKTKDDYGYNGAMSTRQCQRLTAAFLWASSRPTRVIVLRGGRDFWSNGVHLNTIEAAESPSDESWANINAIDDLAEAILRCETQLTVAAVGGNTGAGGCFLARAADQVWVRDGVMLNPHYKNMGNLFGSEFWTYLLPPRVGDAGAQAIMRHRLPMTAQAAVRLGFYDSCLPGPGFTVDVARRAAELAGADDFAAQLAEKQAKRQADEAAKPLADYRAEELKEMRRNFYGFDPSYHVARYHFVSRTLHSWTPRHLARHRDLDWKIPQ